MSLRWPEPLEELVGTSVDDLQVRLRKVDNVFSAETGGSAGAREIVDPTKRMQLKRNTSTTRPSLQHAIVHLVSELLATHRCRVQLEPEPAPPEPVPRLPGLCRCGGRAARPNNNWTTWDLREFTRQEKIFHARAQVPIEADNGNAFTARQRRVALNHARRGVLASLRYHAAGSSERVAYLIVGAVSAFGVGERVLGRLEALVPERAASGDDAAETALYIVSQAREALSELKKCQTEAQRGEYYAALCVLSSEAVVEREVGGMGRRVKAALGLHRSNAVLNECRKIRAAFDASVRRKGESIAVVAGVVRELRPDSSCTVEYTAEGVSTLIEYKHSGRPTKVAGTSGRAAGVSGTRLFATLRRPPVPLAPSARAERKDKLSIADLAKVHAFFYANGAVSPCTRDRVRRRALVAMQTMAALHSQFQTERVLCGTPLSYSSFKKLAPWNLRRINRETCLCRTCELYKCYHDAMDTAPAIFSLPDATPAA
ncbi:hypothetical protein T492DRAFT_1109824, partial [Pavlovales sp. CCMP2436]